MQSGLPRPSVPVVSADQQVLKCQIVPAPNGGINAVDMLAATPNVDSIFQYNMIPAQYGCRARTGQTAWATNIGAGVAIGTILPYNGSTGSFDKLFCTGPSGIYDISTIGTNNPAATITFGIVDTTSGYGQWCAAATLGGHFLLYCDESNGYYIFTEGSGWAKVTLGGGGTQISNVDPATFVQPVIFKERVWFVQKNTSTAWYLPTGAVFGAATQFNFGNKFRHGGYLVGLYDWTLDGGNGIDDYLVAVSSSGDVLIYQGTDPSVATSFSLVGMWYIGPPPAGRRIAGSFGGDIYLLSSYGLLPLSKLIAGILVQDQTNYLTRKITPLITTLMSQVRTTLGWEVKLIPSENLLLIANPPQTGVPPQQFVQSLNTQGWAIYRDIVYNTGEVWNGVFYIGDRSGNVNTHTGNTDKGTQINWSLITSFQEYEEWGRYHRIGFIRPVFLSTIPPAFGTQARFDYNLSEVLVTTIPGAPPTPAWDVSHWDIDLWGGANVEIEAVRGATGLGRAMAVGLNGSSVVDTILIRFDIMYDSGNYL